MIPYNVDANCTVPHGTGRDFTMPDDLVITNARGRWFATAKSVPGLYVSSYSEDEVRRAAPGAVAALRLWAADWLE